MRRLSPLLMGSYVATFATLVSAHPGNHSADLLASVWLALTQGDNLLWWGSSLLVSLTVVQRLHRRVMRDSQPDAWPVHAEPR